MLKDMMPKIILALILTAGSGFIYILGWGHAHAEDKVEGNTTRLEIHITEDEIEESDKELTQIHLSPHQEAPFLIERKRKIVERLRELRDRLSRLKS